MNSIPWLLCVNYIVDIWLNTNAFDAIKAQHYNTGPQQLVSFYVI